MLRHFLIISIAAFVISGCASSRPVSSVDAVDLADRAEAALSMLSEDISDESASSAMDEDAVSSFLPDSYRIYSEYVPLYEPIKDAYAASVISVLGDANEVLDSLFVSYADSMKARASSVISSDTALVDMVRAEHRDVFVSCLSAFLEGSSALADAFGLSYSAFSSVKKAYDRLEEVGFSLSLPIPEPVDAAALSQQYVDAYFLRLSGYERLIKNQRLDSEKDSVYSVFWRSDV